MLHYAIEQLKQDTKRDDRSDEGDTVVVSSALEHSSKQWDTPMSIKIKEKESKETKAEAYKTFTETV